MTFTGEAGLLLAAAIALMFSAAAGVELANYLWGF
jgi:hypothetical protein